MADRRGSAPLRRAAFTLLELMLAIALTGFVMVLVGMAINMHLRSTEHRRRQVEHAQLARAILQQIADDLRGTVLADTADFSGVADLASVDNFLPGVEEAAPAAAADATGSLDQGADEADEIVDNIASSAAVSTSLGLYGDRYTLLLDVGHLPGRDELARAAAGVETAEPMGDVQSVAYYLAGGGQASSATNQTAFASQTANPSLGVASAGLIRRAIDRAAERWAGEQGGGNLLENAELIAPEVRGLEFRYFDGDQWVERWNSQDMGDLPIAVEIAIEIQPSDDESNRSIRGLGLETARGTIDVDSIFRLVVRMPTAQPVNEEDLAAQDAQQADESAGGGEAAQP